MPNKKGQGVSNKKGQGVPQMRLAKTALAAPVARPMTSATTATATRLLSSTYSYVSDSQSANDNFDYTYTYDKNGLPTSVVGTDGLRRDYEFTLNAQGYWTQRTVSSSKNGTPVSTVQTRRTYDDQNRVTSEAEYTINSADTDFVLTSKNVYSYDNGADGYRSSHTVYNALGAETSIEQTLWLNAVGGYVTNLWSYPFCHGTLCGRLSAQGRRSNGEGRGEVSAYSLCLRAMKNWRPNRKKSATPQAFSIATIQKAAP